MSQKNDTQHPTRTPKPETRKPAGLYIHIPFCMHKCAYCDFYSLTELSWIPDYLNALKTEMLAADRSGLRFDTIYFGGGTPSLLKVAQVADLLDQIFRIFPMASDMEITMEANPGTVTARRLKGYYRAGIRRINIGVQSFHSETLSFLQRIHSRDQAIQAIREARDAGFRNLGLDLIFGVPGQDASMWRSDLRTALDFSPEHLSCYMLSYEKGTPLKAALAAGQFDPLTDEATAALFELTHRFLCRSGYEHYEISNFARKPVSGEAHVPGSYRSRHNQKYWSFAPYIGLGAAAHSFRDRTRTWNHADVKRYIGALKNGKPPLAGREVLSRKQQVMEAVLLGLRTAAGIDLAWFETFFQSDFRSLFAAVLPDLLARDWLRLSRGRCFLTVKGMLLLDSIVARLIDAIPD